MTSWMALMNVARTVRNSRLGKRELRLVEKDGTYFGLADGKICAEGDDADDVWKMLHDEAGKADPKYFGYSDARIRFLKFFPDGFHSDAYAAHERNYKIAAKKKLDKAAPLEDAVSGSGYGKAVLAAYRATNLLSPYEKTWLEEILRGPDADRFVQAAAAFTTEGSKGALARMESVLKPHDCAKWSIATYLPYLWRPDEHMFLKPEATKDFAIRVGHPFGETYGAKLSFDVYTSLLDLVEQTAAELSDLNPRDRIDIQSFIWIVGNYREDSDGDII